MEITKINEYIKSDCFRYFGKIDIVTMIFGYLGNPLFRFQVAMRMASGGGDYVLHWKSSMVF